MNRRLQAMISALAPSMTGHTAEVTLRATALSRGKQVELLSSEDLPALENAVRQALAPVASAASIGLTVYKIRKLFLEGADGAGC